MNARAMAFSQLASFLASDLQVKYRQKYINSLGTWKSIPDRPEFFFSKIANDNISNVSTPTAPYRNNIQCNVCVKTLSPRFLGEVQGGLGLAERYRVLCVGHS